MKNLVVFYNEQGQLDTALEDIPVPSSLEPHDVLIKVAVAGSNPKDWKHPLPAYFNNKLNQGDDCAGKIAAIGSAVKAFKVRERVAGFHEMDTLNGTYAEFAICPEQTVFRIPDSMSDEEAATLPLSLFTASVGLYRNLGLPAPWDRSDGKAPATARVPLVVNAASSAVGAYAIKLAKLNPRIGPIIATAGSSADFVKTLGADAVVDYRSPSAADEIKKAASGLRIRHAFDASNSVASVECLTAALEPGSRYTSTMPTGANPIYGGEGEMDNMLDEAGLWHEQIWVGEVHETKKAGGQLFGSMASRMIELLLAEGKLRGHPHEGVEKGLGGVREALLALKERKVGNAKFVTRIADTPGIGRST